MRRCGKCGVSFTGDLDRCPLCQAELSGEAEPSAFPRNEVRKSGAIALAVLAFATGACLLVMLFLGHLLQLPGDIVVTVCVGLVVNYLFVRNILTHTPDFLRVVARYFLVLLAINPAHAWGDGFVRILKGGFHDAPYGVGKELANAAPLVMTGLSVAFAFKTGLFNIGAAGQYTLGAYGALYCAIMLKMPWFVCLLAATLLGGIWGAIPGFFKAYFNINEVITSIMFNWIGLYLVNELVYQNGTGPMYDVRNTRTLNLSKNPAFAQSIIPDFGLNKMFQTNSTTIAIFLAAAVAILIWVVLNKTTFGYELKAVGLNKSAARYAGINEKKNIILSMAIAGALAGFGAGLYFLSNVSQWNPLNSTSLPAMGFNGISVALLASSNPIGTIFSALFISHISVGGSFLSTKYYPTEISDLISGIIIYLCAFSMLFRGKIHGLLFKNADKTNVNAEPAPAKTETKKEGK